MMISNFDFRLSNTIPKSIYYKAENNESIENGKSFKIATSYGSQADIKYNPLEYQNGRKLQDFIQIKPTNLQRVESKSADILATLLQDSTMINATKINKTQNTASNQFYDYSVDENGYMGEDFNVAANLPSGFKIHKDTLDEIIERSKSNNAAWYNHWNEDSPMTSEEAFRHIDIANTIKQYYNIFAQIIGEGKESYSLEEVQKMPKGFSDLSSIKSQYDKSVIPYEVHTLEGFQVTHLYHTQGEYKEAKALSWQLSSLRYNFKIYEVDFALEFLKDSTLYQADGDTFSQEALFAGFLQSRRAEIQGGGETQFSQVILNHQAKLHELSISDKLVELFEARSHLMEQALRDPDKLKELIKLNIKEATDELLGKNKTFSPNEIAANFGGAVMDIYAWSQFKSYRANFTYAQSVDFTLNFTEAVHSGWNISKEDIANYTNDLFQRIQKIL